MKKVRVIMPTLKTSDTWEEAIKRVMNYAPFDVDLQLVTDKIGWPKSINKGLEGWTGDVILIDDDCLINKDTFKDFDRYYPHAEIFGFKLLAECGAVLHAGGKLVGLSVTHYGEGDVPKYVIHVTTSLCYIKKEVIAKIGGIDENFPGYQYEDVDFNFRALRAGFRVMYVPTTAIHKTTQTKKHFGDFAKGMGENAAELGRRWMSTPEWIDFLKEFPKEVKL